MGALSLRALDVVRRRVGMVAGTSVGCGILSSVLVAGVCVVLRLGGWGWGFGFGWGGWGGLDGCRIGPCDRFFPWWGGYGGRFGVLAFNRFGTFNRFGGIAPLHGGTRFSNVAHINDAHISRRSIDRRSRAVRRGRTAAVAATHAQLSSAHMMTGNMPVVPTRASLSASGRAAAPSTIHSSASQHFFGHADHRANRVVPAADGASATIDAAEPFFAGCGWRTRDRSSRCGIPGHGWLAEQGRALARRRRVGRRIVLRRRVRGMNLLRMREARGGPASPASAEPRGAGVSARAESNGGEWKSFTPSSHSSESAGREAGAAPVSRGESAELLEPDGVEFQRIARTQARPVGSGRFRA